MFIFFTFAYIIEVNILIYKENYNTQAIYNTQGEDSRK